MNVRLPDGTTLSVGDGARGDDVACAIGPGLAKAALAMKVNGQVRDLSAPLYDGDRVEILTFDSAEGRAVFWHSSAHIVAMAVQRLFPTAKLAIGPAIESGFYYDFDVERPFTPEDLTRIEGVCREIVAARLSFVRREMSRDEAETLFRGRGETYKLEMLAAIEGTPSVYQTGEWLDLCRGPHVPDTGVVKALRLLSAAGAYWRGDERNKMLQRIYGISFPKQSMLDEHLRMLEEAKKRDHRRLGVELGLYSLCEAVGPGLVLWHPKGGRLRTIVEDFWRSEHLANGYELVYSPHIGRAALWHTSGHLDFFRENMYAPMKIDEQEYFIKPMNCPFHIMIYKSQAWSYRDLPLRWAELGTVYRYEDSGVLHGLLRVRGFTQDDAHLICRPDQMPEEIARVLRFCLSMLTSFGFKKFKTYLATRPKAKAVGDERMWCEATSALEAAVRAEGLDCAVDEGGGAFYGPKIDIKIRDALNREWQCSTIQFDFNEPERFDMTYVDSDNQRRRPYMIHRALLGSIERFMGILIEHYAGALPLWLSPVQLAVIAVSDKYLDYARSVFERCRKAGIRAVLDERPEKIGYKIRDAEVRKVPYMAVVGDKELVSGGVALRRHGVGDLGGMSVDAMLERLADETRRKA